MKFGESLNEGLVPEWKDQYVDYKAGKKQIHKVADKYLQLDKKPTDTTPLLNPLDDDLQYVPELPNENLSRDEPSIRRRPSVFNFSTKSLKDKTEDFLEERASFMKWLDDELKKVDNFFREKEKDAYERFLILEDQIYQLKDHRLDISRKEKTVEGAQGEIVNVDNSGITLLIRSALFSLTKYERPTLPSMAFLDKWRDKGLPDVILKEQRRETEFDANFRENQIRNGHRSYDSDEELTYSGDDNIQPQEHSPAQIRQSKRRDYQPKKLFGVPYLYAKKQLKEALVEHFRSISLLKSFRVMNRTALRKITKKFDKAVHASILSDFMTKVDTESYFQTSVVLEKILSRVEDLFLTYFDSERLDRKHGLEKLRSATYAYNNADIRHPQFYKSTFGTGLFLGVGFPLFAIALYYALENTLSGSLPEGRYLLQIWGGIFLANFALLLVGINLLVYAAYKINYKFIFEFNLASALDYRQYWVLPAFGFALMGVLMWFSFLDFWPDIFPGRDFPLLFIGIVLIIFLWPGKQMHAASRRWLQIALWRILCSGFYPVEFRDFFLGDILCSLTYSASNISFFFCLYAVEWKHVLGGGRMPKSTARCGSSHSRAMGFFSSLPSIWRFMQCLRRYMDTGDEFPHLANMLKYLIGAIYYCLLSLWRIDHLQYHRILFIVFATINSLYCSVWDIVMDWSLGQTNSKHFLLRDHLFYGSPLYYYAAIVVDVILRFQWLFYVFFTSQIQQLAVTSFGVALAEILRRFIWMFFRMENEHCTNVVLFRASRDSPLPYMISLRVERAVKKLVDSKYDVDKDDFATPEDASETSMAHTTAYSASAGLLNKRTNPDDEANLGVRRRTDSQNVPALERRKSTYFTISDVLKKAHIKDFQRKKYAVQVDSDDDEEEEDIEHSGSASKRLPNRN